MSDSCRRSLRAYFILTGLAAAGACFTAFVHPDAPPWSWSRLAPGEVDFSTARTWAEIVWVDARNADEYASEHIPGAVRLAEDDWSNGVGRLLSVWRPGVPVVVYCGSSACGASKAVAGRLRGPEYGFEKVYVLEGGWESYASSR
jgi:rhodanese-related sulfurtransferase